MTPMFKVCAPEGERKHGVISFRDGRPTLIFFFKQEGIGLAKKHLHRQERRQVISQILKSDLEMSRITAFLPPANNKKERKVVSKTLRRLLQECRAARAKEKEI